MTICPTCASVLGFGANCGTCVDARLGRALPTRPEKAFPKQMHRVQLRWDYSAPESVACVCLECEWEAETPNWASARAEADNHRTRSAA